MKSVEFDHGVRSQVLVSYSSSDRRRIDPFIPLLDDVAKRRQVEVFLDYRAGLFAVDTPQVWISKVPFAAAFIQFVSVDWIRSPACRLERALAMNCRMLYGTPIISVLLDPVPKHNPINYFEFVRDARKDRRPLSRMSAGQRKDLYCETADGLEGYLESPNLVPLRNGNGLTVDWLSAHPDVETCGHSPAEILPALTTVLSNWESHLHSHKANLRSCLIQEAARLLEPADPELFAVPIDRI